MAKKDIENVKNVTFQAKDVKLVLDDSSIDEMAAEASISLNRNVAWAKIVLTDDDFNANKQRIPRDEFSNVIKTGLYMPFKMTAGEIGDHPDSIPIGVMAHLKTNGNTVEALAALWKTERDTDVAMLQERYKSQKPIDVSWEISYTEKEEEEAGTTFKGVSMNAITIVENPAYKGRTSVTALSSKNKENNEDGSNMDTIALDKHEELMKTQREEFETKVSDAEAKVQTLSTELDELKPKYKELAEFKQESDEKTAKAEKLENIKTKFKDAGLEVKEEYFTEKEEIFLGMTDAQLDFVVQELVSLASKKENDNEETASISLTSTDVPNVTGSTGGSVNKEDILEFLKKEDK